ncbi:Tim44/TimA family putative adaptor protein [Paracoccus aerodenitrificans]|uniref:Tim44/TimA family putative adaptor protein n=1 Tax=Paracoccus aerodenitrificans TaxID=3017781 RepID=UPI0022F1437F|nr:Tim44/TimA family putative adaptor protein [Paracoccus aerodenitrificans]WBU63803.1 Tim44/TimA family putative adaptor protein [Paracoccus aerodenitrificans]
MSNPVIQLIVLAAIAVFLILRLRGVLGTRDGFEPSRVEQDQAERDFRVVEDDASGDDSDLTDHVDPESPAYAALVAMKQVEPSFSLGEFLSGAKQAYEMILVAFENGNLDDVRAFLAPDVAEAFDGAIAMRDRSGRTVEVDFLGTRETSLAAAEFDTDSNIAELSVRFVGEMIVATRDADGQVVEGDAKKPRKQRDTWTFEREMGAADPNWRLVATGA